METVTGDDWQLGMDWGVKHAEGLWNWEQLVATCATQFNIVLLATVRTMLAELIKSHFKLWQCTVLQLHFKLSHIWSSSSENTFVSLDWELLSSRESTRSSQLCLQVACHESNCPQMCFVFTYSSSKKPPITFSVADTTATATLEKQWTILNFPAGLECYSSVPDILCMHSELCDSAEQSAMDSGS